MEKTQQRRLFLFYRLSRAPFNRRQLNADECIRCASIYHRELREQLKAFDGGELVHGMEWIQQNTRCRDHSVSVKISVKQKNSEYYNAMLRMHSDDSVLPPEELRHKSSRSHRVFDECVATCKLHGICNWQSVGKIVSSGVGERRNSTATKLCLLLHQTPCFV